LIHVGWSDLHVFIGENTMWTSQETVQLGIWMQFLAHVEDTHNDVMTASSLTTTKNATKSKRLLKLLMTHNDIILLLKLEVIHTIGKQSWEQFLHGLINWELFFMKHDITLGNLCQWNWNFWHKLESVQLVLGEVTILSALIVAEN
jgi:hypothetical protein